MRTTLPTSVAFSRAVDVFRASGMDRAEARTHAIAAAYSLWVLGDSQADLDGVIQGAGRSWVEDGLPVVADAKLAVDALVAAGWLELIDGGGVRLPDWDKHNGKLARKREQGRERAKSQRQKAASRGQEGGVRAECAHGARTVRARSAPRGQVRTSKERTEDPPPGGAGGGGDPSGSSPDRLTVIGPGQSARWTRDDGLFLPSTAMSQLRKAYPDRDIEALLAGWDAWRLGEDGPRARNPMGSIEAWIRNRPAEAGGGDGPPQMSDEEFNRMAAEAIAEVKAEQGRGAR